MIGWILVLSVLYLAGCLAAYAGQRRLIYFPDRRVPIPGEVGLPEFRTVTATSGDGLALNGLYGEAGAETQPTILYLQGNAGNAGDRAGIAAVLRRAGFGVLLAGYRGYGGNAGDPSEAGLTLDARAWADWLVERGVSGRRLILYGESLGTGLAVALAAERRAGGVILQAPFTSLPDAGAAAYPFLPVRLLMKDRFDSLSRIAEVKAPLLVIHGEADRVVPLSLGRRLFDAAGEPKQAVWVPRAGHNDLALHGLYDVVLEWLAGLQGGTKAGVMIEQSQPKGTALVRR